MVDIDIPWSWIGMFLLWGGLLTTLMIIIALGTTYVDTVFYAFIWTAYLAAFIGATILQYKGR